MGSATAANSAANSVEATVEARGEAQEVHSAAKPVVVFPEAAAMAAAQTAAPT